MLAEPVCFLVARIYGQHMEKDKALERRFQQVFIKQPNVEDTVSFPLAEVSKGLIEFCAFHPRRVYVGVFWRGSILCPT